MRKIILLSIGFISLFLGIIGSIIPILPTVPFLLVSTYCFANSSKRITNWFKNTKLYKNNLEDYVNHKGMYLKTKVKIMMTVSFVMLIGFIMMGLKGIIEGCIILAIIWLLHVIYFIFGIKTLSNTN